MNHVEIMQDCNNRQQGALDSLCMGTTAVHLYLSRLSPNTRPAQTSALRWYAAILGHVDPTTVSWCRLTRPAMLALRQATVDRYAPRTARRMLSALRGVLDEERRGGRMTRAQYDDLVDIPRVRGGSTVAGRMLSKAEVDKLLEAADPLARACVVLMVAGGLRRAEVAALRTDHVRKEPGSVENYWIYVHGKGGKIRCVPIFGKAARHFGEFYEARGTQFAENDTNLFKLTLSGISRLLSELSKYAGVKFTPHDLRRTFASRALDTGADIVTVQRAMGHSDPRITASYDRRGVECLEELGRKLSCI